MTFSQMMQSLNPLEKIEKYSQTQDPDRVLSIVKKDGISYNDLLYLLSDTAKQMLPPIAAQARNLTIQRFGKIIQFYVPIYLSNECNNVCVYCGFNHQTQTNRVTLTLEEVEHQYKTIKDFGFDNVLLLTGEAPDKAGVQYIADCVSLAKNYFTFVGLEVFPMDVEGYSRLVEAGADGLTIYQETYHPEVYRKMHRKGKKTDYHWRLTTPERALEAGFRKIGLGALLGLYDYRYEAAMLAKHIDYLQKKYWKSEITLSFPRLRLMETFKKSPYPVDDKDLIHMICVCRLYFPEVGFILSTRESPDIRDNLIQLCITQMSAGSKTNPGGYTNCNTLEQFSASDQRDLNQMMDIVRKKGYEPVLKDWDKVFTGTASPKN